MDGTSIGVLDRFEGDYAVLVVQEGGQDVGDYLVEAADIPPEERHEDAVFEVRIENNEISDLDYLAEETAERETDSQARFDRLSNRLGDDSAE
ncbi:DUF3006 domain-containing protein (plasmid) [Halarchaeum sp. CBA1220]|uniref:DUF3006 family protein n=1 Tax=Halarchaeum grantii TaxID=1193105 RepID=A0A830FFD4_9EURY|nr:MULTISPECIES: DUF3006 domain-containing protein [Halarchaeum]QLC35530.1 DUF3006 domain-containing protein [Halarchaeum sp. CBA1220]GGL41521.1 hypothetical protein GCM10009037_26390 [Halarchaeum grantii]